MQKIDLYDELTFAWSDTEGIRLDCLDGNLPAGEENIVCRAAAVFFGDERTKPLLTNRGVVIALQKTIPVAAGLGGGSSDAAATLTSLNHLCDNPLSAAELDVIGLRLGADVPFFLAGAPACLAEGIGEKLVPAEPLRGCTILLINPGFPVSTQWVYQTFALTKKDDRSSIKNLQSEGGANLLPAVPCPEPFVNDLEAVTCKRYPVVAQIKADLLEQGAGAALMSGSGPTVFGLYHDRELAEAAFGVFKKQFEQTYLVAGLIGCNDSGDS